MIWEVEYSDEFGEWWVSMDEDVQEAIHVSVTKLSRRVLYAFDPRRAAYLIIGGCKAGNPRFYEEMVPKADRIFERHLQEVANCQK